ncbi:hypothetical protein BOTBODRAFT_88667, partial [Botryobasidium botryosum FD-172 SS1]
QKEAGEEPWAPFVDLSEAEFANWLIASGLSHKEIENHLKLNITRECTKPSFKDKHQFFSRFNQLPHGPEWHCETITVIGNLCGDDSKPLKETLEVRFRNPIECIKEILQNPAFKDHIAYAPLKQF